MSALIVKLMKVIVFVLVDQTLLTMCSSRHITLKHFCLVFRNLHAKYISGQVSDFYSTIRITVHYSKVSLLHLISASISVSFLFRFFVLVNLKIKKQVILHTFLNSKRKTVQRKLLWCLIRSSRANSC